MEAQDRVNELQAQVSELEENLRTTSDLLADAQAHKDSFKNNFENLKTTYLQETASLRQQLTQAQNERALEKRNYEENFREWKAELDKRASEFERLSNEVVPKRDYEMVKVQLMEELEGPHKQQLELMEKEVEKYRTLYNNSRKELGEMQTAADDKILELEKAVESERAERNTIERDLSGKLHSLHAALEDSSELEKIRALQRENSDLKARCQTLFDEANDLRESRQKAVSEQHASEATLRQDLNWQIQQSKELAARNDILNQKMATVERSNKDLTARLKESHDQNVSAEKALSDARARSMEDLAKKGEEISSLHAIISENEQKFQAERDKLHADIRSLNEQVVESDHQCRRYMDESVRSVHETDEKINRVREEEEAKRRKVEAENARLQDRVNEVELRMGETEERTHEAIEMLRKENQSLKMDVRGLDVEKSSYQSKFEEAQNRCNDLDRQLLIRQKECQELGEEYAKLQDKHRDALQKEHLMSVNREELELQVEYLQRDIAKLAKNNEMERDRATSGVDQIKRQIAQERAAHKMRENDFTKKLNGYKKKLVSTINTAKQNHEQFKEKVRRLTDRNEYLQTQLTQAELAKSTVEQSMKLDHMRRIREVNRAEISNLLNVAAADNGHGRDGNSLSPLKSRFSNQMADQMADHSATMSEINTRLEKL